MFDTYQAIFNQRGAAYHAAMSQFPHARDEEFRQVVALAEPRDGDFVLDMPSGGGYLARFLPQRASLTCVDSSAEFAARAPKTPRTISLHRELTDTRLPSIWFDKIICLAGLHHAPQKPAIFAEAYRLLTPSGSFCIADAAVGSGPAAFLDVFVNAHSSMGHKGDYISADTAAQLEAAGFGVAKMEPRPHHWTFGTVDEMTTFCGLLFGIDRATPAEIEKGIAHHLGFQKTKTEVRMNWNLTFILANKRKARAA